MTTATPLNPFYFAWGVGEKHKVEALPELTDAQGRVWRFSSWSNGGNAAQIIDIPLDADVTGGVRLTATYTQLGKLTVTSPIYPLSVQVDGADCATPCEVVREMGQRIRIAAPPSIGQGEGSRLDFNGWPGGGLEYVVTLGEVAQTVSAGYHTMNRLAAASDPPNGASWRVDPESPDSYYRNDAIVSISLTAQPGFRFRRWDGDLTGVTPNGVLAMNAPRSVRAVLDAVPYIAPAGVTNAAGATPSTAVAPASIISIFGANLSSSTASAGVGMLPQTLGGTTVRVGDRLLPLVFASPEQINAVLPSDLAMGQQILTVTPANMPDVRTNFTVARNAPGLFVGVFHEDGSAVSAESPARKGELLTVYGTGFGPTVTPRFDGFPVPASPDLQISDGIEGKVDGSAVEIVKSVAAPGKVGIDRVQFRIAAGTTSGSLRITVNSVESNPVTLPIE
jgi:uncharacterized protein (TIGR03437 family)